MVSLVSNLELRRTAIPLSVIVALLGRELGRSLPHEHRHYVSGRPVHRGDHLELYRNGYWIEGRYEWSGLIDDEPTLHTRDAVLWLDESSLLRWPVR